MLPHRRIIAIVFFLLVFFSKVDLFAVGDQTADFSVDNRYPISGQTVTFTDESDGAEAWSWNFGSGANPATANTQGPHIVTYSTNGSKTVILEIMYDGSDEDRETKRDYIYVGAPTAGAIGVDEFECSSFDPARINSSVDGTGPNMYYQWEYSVSPFTNWVVIPYLYSERYDPSSITQTTYYRRKTVSEFGGISKVSEPTAYVIKAVEATPVAPASATSDRNNICYDDAGNINLSVTGGSGNTVRWFTGSCGETDIGTGNPLSIASPATTTTYYARWENSCGESTCANVTVTVVTTPTAPTSASSDINNICSDDAGNISLSVTGGSGNAVRWFTGSCGETDIGTGNPLVIPSPTTTTTYYAWWENSCGNTSCASTTVTVYEINAYVSRVGDEYICPGFISPPFNPESGINYNIGATQVEFSIVRQNSTSNWSFYWEIDETDIEVNSYSPNLATGTYTGSGSPVNLIFYITNVANTQQTVTFTVSDVEDTDHSCNEVNTSDNVGILYIMPMPEVGSFE